MDLDVFCLDAPNELLGPRDTVMTATLNDANSKNAKKSVQSTEEAAAVELIRMANEQGCHWRLLIGRGPSLHGALGGVKQFTRSVLETTRNEEMTEHLGHEMNQVSRSCATHPGIAMGRSNQRSSRNDNAGGLASTRSYSRSMRRA